MIVWFVQAGYRMDYQVIGIYATKELAETAQSAYMEGLGNSRDNPSWEYTVSSAEVQGLSQTNPGEPT